MTEPAPAVAENSAAPLASPERDALRARIEAAERRIQERTLAAQAREATEAAGDYARAHPLTVVLGALAVGVAIGAMTRPGRRFYGRVAAGAASGASEAASAVSGAAASVAAGASSGVRRAAAKPASWAGGAVLDWAVAYLASFIEEAFAAARIGQDRIEDIGDEAGTRARKLRRSAAHLAASTADSSRTLARRTRRKATRTLRDLAGR